MLRKFFKIINPYVEINEAMEIDIQEEMNFLNAQRAQYILFIGIVSELGLILFYDLPRISEGGLWQQNNLYYFVLHSFMFVVSLFGFIRARKILQDKSFLIWKNLDFEKVVPIISFIFLSSTALINSLDQSFSGSIAIYIANLLLISVLILIKPPANFAVFLSSHLIFMIGMIMNQDDKVTLAANLINGSIIMSCGLVISTAFYQNFHDNILKTFMLKEANEKLEFLSNVDPLTGLYNRRFFYDYMEKQLNYLKRYNDDCAVVIYDLENFKEINDTHGHLVGDEVLKSFAGILKKSSRDSDLAVRWGGDEFVVVLFRTSLEEAKKITERLIDFQKETSISYGDSNSIVSVSAGLVMLNDYSVAGLDKAFSFADRALYKAKKTGKNRIEIYDAEEGRKFA